MNYTLILKTTILLVFIIIILETLTKQIEFYEKALEYNPNNVYANFNLGHTLFYRDSLKSRQYLNKAYELDPKHPCTNIMLGRLDKIEGNEAVARAKISSSL